MSDRSPHTWTFIYSVLSCTSAGSCSQSKSRTSIQASDEGGRHSSVQHLHCCAQHPPQGSRLLNQLSNWHVMKSTCLCESRNKELTTILVWGNQETETTQEAEQGASVELSSDSESMDKGVRALTAGGARGLKRRTHGRMDWAPTLCRGCGCSPWVTSGKFTWVKAWLHWQGTVPQAS